MNFAEFGNVVQEQIKEAMRDRGTATLLIAGKTGVGKSTLVNAVFAGRIAETGQGRPITPGAKEYSKDGVPLRIVDTRGLELDHYHETVVGFLGYLKERNSRPDPGDHIHAAWYCIAEDSRRVEDQESALVEAMSQHVPVLGVITKARSDGGFRDVAVAHLPEARNVIRVRAIEEMLDDGHVLPPFNLDALIEATLEIVPEGQATAFGAAQRVALRFKMANARKAVAAGATAAAAAGAAPIPFSDAALLVPIQVAMLARISVSFNLDVSRGFLATIVSSTIAGVAGTFAGRALVGGVLKMLPGVGWAAGGAISGGTAATMTTLFGEAYIRTLVSLFENDPTRPVTADEVARAFKMQLKG